MTDNPSTGNTARRAAERRDLQAALDRQHAATIVAVTLGIVAGVGVATGVALWILLRARRPIVLSDDPDAPLFV